MAANDTPGGAHGVRASLFRDLPTVLHSQNADFLAICANANVEPSAIIEGRGLIPFPQASLLLQGAATATGDQNFALRFAKFVPPGSSGLFGQLQVTSPTIRDLMRTTVAFAELALRPVVPEWEDFGENGVFTARLPVENVGSIRQLTDLLMALLVFRIRLGAGDNWLPLEVTFETPKPKETRLYYDFFGDQIRFDEPYFSIVIDEKALDCKLPYDVAGLNDTIRPLAEEALADIKKSDSFPTIVANEIRRQLSDDDDERISLSRIADALSMSTRGLQWRLAQEGADYHTILGQVREEIAIKMLGDPKIQVADVAIAMGFAQTSVFTRWSIRCLGDTPSAVRRKMQHGAWVGPPRAGSV